MRAKRVYESILKGKSKDEIERALNNLDLNDLLVQAAKLGLIDFVKKALDKGAHIHANDDVALRYAANGHLEVVNYC